MDGMYRFSSLISLLWLILYQSLANAATSFSVDPPTAQANQPITVRAIYINDTTEATEWTPPQQLILRWHTEHGASVQALATPTETYPTRHVPVNGFAQAEWQTQVPAFATGIRTLAIDGSPQLLALEIKAPTFAKTAAPTTPTTIEPAIHAIATGKNAEPSLTAFEQVRNALSVYEPMYFIFGTRPDSHARFQISFKYRLLNPKSVQTSRFYHHFYLGYTQRSLWDLGSDSLPFVDSSYNPSLFWYQEKMWQTAASPFYLGLNAGVEHESNGKSGASSRSLNDFYLQPELNYTFANGSQLRFMPRFKHYVGVSAENADYKDYMGSVNWRLRWQQANGLSLMGSYHQGKQGRRTKQLDVAWPLKRTPLNLNGYLYAQYLNGYGETLLHYNKTNQSQVRIGIALTP
ncbi:outer membrane phospholipase A [Paenalcaligenes hominis]|uniref:Phospholipase A1 n=2 Tax=Paenalcaligenes hominis TaxID=643674 RepID=A0ABX0WN15_9BURK|nr:phospholipase A [Paenalcaligenes hominis]NJB64646.1 outer membrane phospholipase A [Paenalcaligenes hominis]GGE60146.1 phospholipase [Paenalcaligenes hominis]